MFVKLDQILANGKNICKRQFEDSSLLDCENFHKKL